MESSRALAMDGLGLVIPDDPRPLGTRVLAAMVDLAERAAEGLRSQAKRSSRAPAAVLGRLRGTGRGASFTRLVEELDRAHPLALEYPFEGSDRVGGAVWVAATILGTKSSASLAKLRWDSRAMDLPMHVHDHSDRFIIVAKGRGYFHVSDEPADAFTGKQVRSIPARERDIFLFSRGTVHTFSTDAEPMTLLSCQLPFLAFNDSRQYRLPTVRWTAKEQPEPSRPGIACDAGWTVLAERRSTKPTISLADLLTAGP